MDGEGSKTGDNDKVVNSVNSLATYRHICIPFWYVDVPFCVL
ncbi:MAG: hypothetical protein RR914_06550 [Oscillospiraceae bacterium]